ncbi:MAG: hypothetical protein KAJ98_08350, partial [Spirochaetaceae bacterium]|nr:hypothetical protein [Spirochaetaceae bacterium]
SRASAGEKAPFIKGSNRCTRLFITTLVLLLGSFTVISAQEGGSESSLSANKLLKDALLFIVDVTVSMPDSDAELWNTRVEKITIPGRAVAVSLEGENSRLKVNFTLYPAEDGKLFLVARSETWVGGEYSSALSSLPVAYRDEVYYYPLGRADDRTEDNPVEVRMAINIIPYLETLDEEARAALESAFDSSAQFDLSGEDP